MPFIERFYGRHFQKNFVNVFKSAMANEIKLIQLQRGEQIS